MHSMKRIALAWEEFQSAGMPAALHVNARCEKTRNDGPNLFYSGPKW